MDLAARLTQQAGPLPVYAWVGLGGLALAGIGWLGKRKAGAGAAAVGPPIILQGAPTASGASGGGGGGSVGAGGNDLGPQSGWDSSLPGSPGVGIPGSPYPVGSPGNPVIIPGGVGGTPGNPPGGGGPGVNPFLGGQLAPGQYFSDPHTISYNANLIPSNQTTAAQQQALNRVK